jgi:hypothetical protein
VLPPIRIVTRSIGDDIEPRDLADSGPQRIYRESVGLAGLAVEAGLAKRWHLSFLSCWMPRSRLFLLGAGRPSPYPRHARRELLEREPRCLKDVRREQGSLISRSLVSCSLDKTIHFRGVRTIIRQLVIQPDSFPR